MKRHQRTPAEVRDTNDLQAAFDAGYWKREDQWGWRFGRAGIRPVNADSEADAIAGIIAAYRRDVREADKAAAELQAQQAAAREAEARRADIDRRVAEANAANAADAGWRITRRPNGLDGWSANNAMDMMWRTLDAAILEQADDADRGRRHSAFRNAVHAAIAAAGGVTRWDARYLTVTLPPAHPKAPRSGELVNGQIAAFTGRGWADVAEWWGDASIVAPDDYPDDA